MDEIELNRFDYKSLKNNVGYVSRKPSIIAATIEDNIKFCKPDATQE